MRLILAVLAGAAAIALAVIAAVQTQPAGDTINLLAAAAGTAGLGLIIIVALDS